MTLREVVHAHIPTLTRTSTIKDAVDKMDVYQFPALVIVNEDKEPIAIITEGDVSRATVDQDSLLSIAGLPALKFGSTNPTQASLDMEIGDALHLMLSSGLTVLPVTTDGRLQGVVCRVDLMQAMLLDFSPQSNPKE